ncbi:MAG: hypothetical protein AB8B62_18710, partial [Roseobacter sp.]
MLTFASVELPELFFHVEDAVLRSRLIEAIRQCMDGRKPEKRVIRHENELQKRLPSMADIQARELAQ